MHFVFDRQSADFKRRTMVAGPAAGGATGRWPRTSTRVLETGQADPGAQPSPDGKWVAFLSDRDGWDHLYVMPADGARRLQPSGAGAIQITKGRFEVWRPAWSRDSTRIAFDANDAEHPGDRQLGIATIGSDPSTATVAMITRGRGTNTARSGRRMAGASSISTPIRRAPPISGSSMPADRSRPASPRRCRPRSIAARSSNGVRPLSGP
jgi:hypothetical protein